MQDQLETLQRKLTEEEEEKAKVLGRLAEAEDKANLRQTDVDKVR